MGFALHCLKKVPGPIQTPRPENPKTQVLLACQPWVCDLPVIFSYLFNGVSCFSPA